MSLSQTVLDAIDRLKRYNLGIYKVDTNPYGLSGVGGMATNWARALKDLATVAMAVAGIAESVAASDGAAAASAATATNKATEAQGYAASAGNHATTALNAAGAAAASAAGVNLPAVTVGDAGKTLVVNPGGTGYAVATASASIQQSAPVYVSSGGATVLEGRSILAVYEQTAGALFAFDFGDYRSAFAEQDAVNGTDASGGAFTLHATALGLLTIKLLVHGDSAITNSVAGGTALVNSGVVSGATAGRVKFGAGALNFAASGAYLQAASAANLYTAGSWQFDAWIYETAHTAERILFSVFGSSNAEKGIVCKITATGNLSVEGYRDDGASPDLTAASAGTVPLNQLVHVRFRGYATGGRMGLMVAINGTASNSGGVTTARFGGRSTSSVTLGAGYAGASRYTGWMDEACYQIGAFEGYDSGASFTPPTTPYLAGIEYVSGPYWVATKPGLSSVDLTGWRRIHSATMAATLPADTAISYLVSFDGYATPLRRWTGSAWVATAHGMTWNSGAGTLTTTATSAQLATAGIGWAELQAGLLALDAAAVASLNVVAVLSSTNVAVSPALDKITLTTEDYQALTLGVDYTAKRRLASGVQTLIFGRLKAGNANHVVDYVG